MVETPVMKNQGLRLLLHHGARQTLAAGGFGEKLILAAAFSKLRWQQEEFICDPHRWMRTAPWL
jgi:hypothetical protein